MSNCISLVYVFLLDTSDLRFCFLINEFPVALQLQTMLVMHVKKLVIIIINKQRNYTRISKRSFLLSTYVRSRITVLKTNSMPTIEFIDATWL